MSLAPAQPCLYGTGDRSEPVLYGQRCAACGHVSFPRQPYGCPACGSPEEPDPCELAATGVVKAAATIRQHYDPQVHVPCTVVSVLLDDGPLIEGVHAGPAFAGDRVRGRMQPAAGQPDRLDLRFESQP